MLNRNNKPAPKTCHIGISSLIHNKGGRLSSGEEEV
jgi:hypothetical protein